MTVLVHSLLLALAIPAVFSCGYLLLLTLLSAESPAPQPSSRKARFDVIIPAHNEAEVIARAVTSLRAVDWPGEQFRILVCADNCTDTTASLAREAGAVVLERQNPAQRGKGYALAFAFRASAEEALADAVVVIDADAEVSNNLLEAMAVRLENGAQAVQVHYGVLNPMASWRTRLITIAKGSFHIVRSRARERMGLSCGIRGTGWCVTHQLLRDVPYQAFSLTEDLEYGIDLGLAGVRVAYVDEADSNADMVSSEQIAGTQRQRWESGRSALMHSKTLPLLVSALRGRSGLCLDLALDLLVPPLSYVALNVAVLLALAAFAAVWIAGAQIWVWTGAACAASLMLYVLRGWQLSGVGPRGLLDLLHAPGFVMWKVLLKRKAPKTWERTERERH